MLSPERRSQLLAATREAAAAFIEDMTYIRNLLKRLDPDRQELRLLSGVLRRLLIDNGGDLRDVAAPRIGRFTILSQDNDVIYKSARKEPFVFFESGGVTAFGVTFSSATVERRGRARDLAGHNPDATIALPMDNFLQQNVLCLQGQWVTRRDVIKYMANIASGVHSGRRKEEVEHLINRIRHVMNYSVQSLPAEMGQPEGTMAAGVAFNLEAAINQEELPFSYDAKRIDPVLIEILATAHFLAISPDIIALEARISSELAGSAA